MANKIAHVKPGMGGSRNGKGRTEKTTVMKAQSKKLRRRVDLEASHLELSPKGEDKQIR